MMTELAPLLADLGRVDESITMHRRALTIRESTLGPDHLETAQSYHNLAHLLEVNGNDREAEPLIRNALRIHQERFGDHHPSTAISLHNLAKILFYREEYREAEMMFRRALDVFDAIIGAEHSTTIICKSSLAGTLMELQRLDEAEKLIHEGLESSRRTAGERHFTTGVGLVRSADLNHRRGNNNVAAQQAAEALSILDETVGKPTPFSALAILILRPRSSRTMSEPTQSACMTRLWQRSSHSAAPIPAWHDDSPI
jgi:tetratricopeptide (TPR) repeat protein